MLGLQPGHGLGSGQTGCGERRREVSPLGDGVATPGSLENHIRQLRPVAELLDQAGLAHSPPTGHDHRAATGRPRAALDIVDHSTQDVEICRPTIELHHHSSPRRISLT